MRLLLDTQAFLWYYEGNPKLTAKAKAHIEDPKMEVFLSAASVWEIVIKSGLGKLRLNEPAEEIFNTFFSKTLHPLPIDWRHAVAVKQLPDHHKDPFDRILAAQSKVEKMPVISSDAIFKAYQVPVLW